MARTIARRKLCLDALEERTLLDGNVTAVVNPFGDLIVAGDNAANELSLDQIGLAADVIRVTGLDGTTVNGQTAPLEITGVTRDIRVSLRGGGDVLHLFDVQVSRNLAINGGTGADLSTRDETTIVGRVRVAGVETQSNDNAGVNALLAGVNDASAQGIGAVTPRQAVTTDVMQVKLNDAIRLLTTPRLSDQVYLDAIDQGMEALFTSSLVPLPTLGNSDTSSFFDVFVTVREPALVKALSQNIDGVDASGRPLTGLGTPASKAAAIEARNFIQVTTEAMQVIGQQTAQCDPTNPGTAQRPTTGCEQLVRSDEGGNIVDTVLGNIFSREVRSPFPFILNSTTTPDEQVILTDPLDTGQCAAIVKEIQGIKVVVTPRVIPIWVEPWFARARIVGFTTVWTWEFVPAEFIKTISVCNNNGVINTGVTTEVILERQLLDFWRFIHKDVTPVS